MRLIRFVAVTLTLLCALTAVRTNASDAIRDAQNNSLDCTFTLGFWKTHPEMWPVGSLTLGTVVYSQSQLLDILNEPVRGNGLVSLSHQVIAVKLNVANGADGSVLGTGVADADALIGGLVVPPVGTGYLETSTTSSFTNLFDMYNNGVIGSGHCGTTPVAPSTWGAVKSLYR